MGTLQLTVAAPARTQHAGRRPLLLALLSLLILALGLIEDLQGVTDSGDVFGSDAVQYLDVARALGRHDWHSALNPLWSQGYPALLALARPLFSPGPFGDVHTIRTVNFLIFAADYAAFLYLLSVLTRRVRFHTALWAAALALFVTTQLCLGQSSRVGPDELVNTLFFLALGLAVRLSHSPRRPFWLAGGLGVTLAAGFLTKAAMLPLGCVLFALLLIHNRRRLSPVCAAAVVFATLTALYGVALSRAVGHPTLGESGSLNYAWHVDRLSKWVHWEGGTEPADEAWPRPALARFARWDTHPPDFGTPVHPSRILQNAPLVLGFDAPFRATYTPYFNPPYWYAGYRHVVDPRYQIIALGKDTGDLAMVLATQPMLLALVLLFSLGLLLPAFRAAAGRVFATQWLSCAVALAGIALYLPVHLEGRYLAAFLTVLGLAVLLALAEAAPRLTATSRRFAAALLFVAFVSGLLRAQLPVWRNLAHHHSPTQAPEWQEAQALLAARLPPDAPIGVLSWTPNLHADWAYLAHVRITSETTTGHDFDLFWKQSPTAQAQTLATFERTGAVAVVAVSKPRTITPAGWQQLGATPMWIFRFTASPSSQP